MNVDFIVIENMVGDQLRRIFASDQLLGIQTRDDTKTNTCEIPKVSLLDRVKILASKNNLQFNFVDLLKCPEQSWHNSIPLILCEDRGALRQMGIMSPYEFTIERQDLLPVVNNKTGDIICEPEWSLFRRLQTLAKLYCDNDGFNNPNIYFK